jgi:GH24 family phage-related lysozyme (muramidase)
VYHYAGNNPVKYVDPDGRADDIPKMDISIQGIQFIKDFEDYSATMYETSKGNGDWTIGWGHKITSAEMASGVFANGITPEKAEELLMQDLQVHIDGVNKNVSNAQKLSQNQFDALVSASYNIGRQGFYESKIREAVQSYGDNISSDSLINTNAFKIKIADSFRYHIPPGSTVTGGIRNRRYNEYKMFVFGDYNRQPTPGHLIPWRQGTLP